MIRRRCVSTNFPITLRFVVMCIIIAITGQAMIPLITAVQNKALIGFNPVKSAASATRVEVARTA